MFFPEDVCMRSGALVIAAAIVLATGPAQAQQPAELVGDYPATISGVGSGCEGHREQATFNVKSVADGKITIGVDGNGFIEADLTPSSMRFVANQTERDRTVRIQGGFTRARDSVGVEMTWNAPNCQMMMVGKKPAPLLPEAPTAPAANPATAAGPSILGTTPAARSTAAAPSAATGMSNIIFWGPLAVLLVVAGGFIGWLVGRSRKTPAGKGDGDA